MAKKSVKSKDVVLICKVRKNDLDAYSDMIAKGMGRTKKKSSEYLSSLRLKDMLKAEIDGEPVGFANFSEHKDSLYLNDIDVGPRHRRKGIGSVLLTAFEKKAKDMKKTKVWLHVNTKEKKTVSFYTKNDYAKTGLVKNYYKKGVDAFVFSKYIR